MSTDIQTQRVVYDDVTVRRFIFASVMWGIVGMLVGVVIALQLAWWPANVDPHLAFGRLRPLHTNAVIFAFVGNMIFAGIYHSTQRLLKARMGSDLLSNLHFWGWQLIIVAAALTLPFGLTQSKEYAELIWPIDVAVTLVWVVFTVNLFLTIAKRNERHLYVAVWFYIATVVTIAILYVTNNLAIPTSLTHSYGVFAGVQDALVQWWYGHNAVAFFLTTPVLGIMYYYVPKAADRPVFSYRLSIIHFWSLIFLYIWAGPHHLLNTALPEWAQTLGMIFSVMLWAPSWGGMLNGLLTLRGAWDKLRTDPVLKFFAAGVTFYGMATFEGPLLSIRSVSMLAHYTDWIIGHAHGGALGWNGFMAAGVFYFLVPRLYGRELHSRSAANLHFYLGTFGILLYMAALYVAGIQQGLMWQAEREDGTLVYARFLETVDAILPMYWMRLVGGTTYLVGFLIMAWNLAMTVRGAEPVTTEIEITRPVESPKAPWGELVFAPPVLLTLVVGALLGGALFVDEVAGVFLASVAVAVAFVGLLVLQVRSRGRSGAWHHLIEGRGVIFTALAAAAVLIGGVAEILPAVVIGEAERAVTDHRPYTALELEGRDVYVSEGCYTCHSQMIRPYTWESARYGAVSTPDDSIWDHPFQWGSRRIGPDLAREGVRNADPRWHWRHMIDPRDTSPGSLMPAYAHLADETVDFGGTAGKLRVMHSLGVPYDDDDIAHAEEDARAQAEEIVALLRPDYEPAPDSELIAIIAYLRRLGLDESPFVPERDRPTDVARLAPAMPSTHEEN
jgi:cytochrome c oxidase cbb3-type subunit I/II